MGWIARYAIGARYTGAGPNRPLNCIEPKMNQGRAQPELRKSTA